MKIHALVLVKNEADIIEFTLASATWADRIHVFDTGSTDDTWERVLRMARDNSRINAWRKEARDYSDNLRAEIFEAVKHETCPDDWWCKLDADEIYAEDPRPVLAAVPAAHHVVWAVHVQYYLTDADLVRFRLDDPAIPVISPENRPRYYKANASEQRFFRHRTRLDWSRGSWPAHLGVVHPRRLLLRHFQYRSPQQIQSRLDIRRDAAARGYPNFTHSLQQDWRETVRQAAELEFDDDVAPLVIDEALLPAHVEPRSHRLLKRFMHGLRIWP